MNHAGKSNGVRLVPFVLAGVALGLVIKLFVLDMPRVQGTSMEPAIVSGQRIVVNKLAFGLQKPFGGTLLVRWGQPRAGDVIVYMYDGQMVVKRCVAMGPCPLECSAQNGYTVRVGEQEIPLTREQYMLLSQCDMVPDGMVLAVGDNYGSSVDSRSYGFVPVQDVLGRVLCR